MLNPSFITIVAPSARQDGVTEFLLRLYGPDDAFVASKTFPLPAEGEGPFTYVFPKELVPVELFGAHLKATVSAIANGYLSVATVASDSVVVNPVPAAPIAVELS